MARLEREGTEREGTRRVRSSPPLLRRLAVTASLLLATTVLGTGIWGLVWLQEFRGSRPSPRYFEYSWDSNKSVITTGEQIALTLRLRSLWDKRIEFTDSPAALLLDNVDTWPNDAIEVPLLPSQGTRAVDPGGTVTVGASLPPDVTGSLETGRYNATLAIPFIHSPGTRDERAGQVSARSLVLFTVGPSQGALEHTFQIGKGRQSNDILVTLESIASTPEQTIIVASAELLGAELVDSATVPLLASPAEWRLNRLYASYRLDGGALHELWAQTSHATHEGVRHQWTFGPIPANANTIEVSIRSGMEPAEWRWTVPLRGNP